MPASDGRTLQDPFPPGAGTAEPRGVEVDPKESYSRAGLNPGLQLCFAGSIRENFGGALGNLVFALELFGDSRLQHSEQGRSGPRGAHQSLADGRNEIHEAMAPGAQQDRVDVRNAGNG
jgi:hypothetical protein